MDDSADAQASHAFHQLVDTGLVRVVAVEDGSAPVDDVPLTAGLGVVEELACDVVGAVFGGLCAHVGGVEDGHEVFETAFELAHVRVGDRGGPGDDHNLIPFL